MKVYNTTHQAYLGTLKDVLDNPDYRSAPRGLPILEKTDYQFKVRFPSSMALVTKDLERNQVIADYTSKEMELYDSCTNQVHDFAKASKFWEKLANPDGSVNSAYGYLIWANKSYGQPFFEKSAALGTWTNEMTQGEYDSMLVTPWDWAKNSLIADKDTRQALMKFSLPEHFYLGNKDVTCTMHSNWLIRNDQLHLSVVMRSNDLVKGLAFDLPWFAGLMDKMLEELKPTYPELTKGEYTHTVHSLHLYEKDILTIQKMLGE